MADPFILLEVAETATDEEITKAYLAKVRQYPPEREAERFQEIRAAFEKIKTHKDRLNYQLFHCGPVDIDALLTPLLRNDTYRRPSEASLLRALSASVSETD